MLSGRETENGPNRESRMKRNNSTKGAEVKGSTAVIYVDGTKDLCRSGSVLFGSLSSIPFGLGKEFNGVLPERPLAVQPAQKVCQK